MTTTISRLEAERCIELAYPKQGVRIELSKKGSYKIVKANGEVIGAAFDLLAATRQAIKPVLDLEQQAIAENAEAKKREFVEFMQFLRESQNDAFTEWRTLRREAEAKTAALAASSKSGGDEPDPVKLVQIVR